MTVIGSLIKKKAVVQSAKKFLLSAMVYKFNYYFKTKNYFLKKYYVAFLKYSLKPLKSD